MKCELCNSEAKMIYVTSKYGCICSKCIDRLKNSEEEKLKQHKHIIEMYKKYGLEYTDV